MKKILIATALLTSLSSHAQFYGRLKLNMIGSDNALNSFNNINMSAPTSATNTDLYTGEDGDRLSFQAVQSRFGGKIKMNPHVMGLIEMDFVDFAQASPTTSAHPRLRRAFIEHKLSENFTLQVGQDWDLFSGLNPKLFNYVGNYFNAGNIGFMRQQIIGKYKLNKDQLSFAIAQAGKSSAHTETELENDKHASLTAVYEKAVSAGIIQLGVIASERSFNNQLQKIWGVSLGAKLNYGKNQIIAEFYNGEGLNKLALLSLPNNNFAHEYGGYITSQYELNESNYIFAGIGVAKTQNPGLSSYDAVNEKFANLGAKANTNVRGGHVYKQDGVEYYTELTYYETEYEDSFKATSIELGTLLYF